MMRVYRIASTVVLLINKTMIFSFVILHYNSLNETIQCVDSIKETQNGTCYRIVIVDNNSPDGSGDALEQLWGSEDNIHVIRNAQNLGFACGNNVGFQYAKYELDSDFIILQNSDTLLLQRDFQKRVIEEYETSHFAVLGPFIKTPHPPYTSNPGPDVIPDVFYFRKKLLKYKLHLFFSYLHIDGFITRHHMKTIAPLNKIIDKTKEKAYNVRLHGCFMVFSPNYISRFDGLNEKTFMYGEEDLLFLRLKHNNLTSVYHPQVIIFHQEDASTSNYYSTKNKRNRFKYRCKIQSTKVMINEIKDMINKR